MKIYSGKYKSLMLSVGMISLLSAAPAMAQGEFTGLDDVAGGGFNSQAFAVSSDGTTVVGQGVNGSGATAFRWTSATTIQDLGDLAGGAHSSQANGVSSDGSVVVGRGRVAVGDEAFMWTSGGGLIGLGDLVGGSFDSSANGVSDDGLVIVGQGRSGSGNEAFRWTSGGGMTGLGDLAGGSFFSSANDTNSDGSIVVGQSSSASGFEAFKWTSGGGMVGLGDLAGGGFSSIANAISSDGTTTVGAGESAAGTEAVYWDATDTIQALGDLAGGAFSSEAFDVSADGSVIVGEGTSAAGTRAFIWNATDGMMTVEDLLTNAGVTATGFTSLDTATGVSADGSVIVGTGTSANGTEAFFARIGGAGTGVLNSESVNESIVQSTSVVSLTNLSLSLPLNGAHHRPLMLEHNDKSNYGGWITADAAFNDDGPIEGYLSNQEAGVYGDFLNKKLRLGFGFGLSRSEQDTTQGGNQELKGEYGIAEVNFSPLRVPVILGVLGLYGEWDADLERGYLNGATPDSSDGNTDVQSRALKLSAYWQNAASLKANKMGTINFSPKASFTISNTKIDAFTETGGGFPVRFDSVSTTSKEARLGFEAGTKVNRDRSEVRVTVEAVHKFNSGNTNISGDIIGLSSFDLNSKSGNDTWGRVGLDVDHTFKNSMTLSGSTFVSSTGADPDVSGALSLKVPF